MLLRSIGVAALVLGSAGCKRPGYESRSPGLGGDETAAVYDAEPEFDARDEGVLNEKAAKRRFRGFSRKHKEKEDAPDTARTPAAPIASPSGGEAAPKTPQASPEPADNKPPESVKGRHIIYNAAMNVSVFNLEDAIEKVEAMPEKYGGYIQSMSQGQLIMRIPSGNLRKAMDELGDFGVVEHRSMQTQDVTAEYVDIESRIRVLSETQKQLIGLLAKARTVDEALHVRRALDEITMELEVLKGRMRQLKNLVSYSTLTINLVERGPHMPTPSSNDPFPWVDDLGVEGTEFK